MSGGLVDKVYIGLDNAPVAFDIKGRILGPNGTNLEYIRSETGVVAVLKGDKYEPMHLALHHSRSEAIAAAKSLSLNLIETIKAELVQWSAAQGGGAGAPAMTVPPPTLAATSTLTTVPAQSSVTMTTPTSLASTPQPAVLPPVVSVSPATTPLMTVRQPTVLQFLQPQQQQYVLNQENGQLIPIVQPGMQVSNQISSLPLGQSLGALQQPNFGTQLVDISGQPVNVTQLRLSGVPSSMSMILPNGLAFPQGNINANDSTTVSTATSTPVVCAAQGINAGQKILYSTDKDKMEVKYIQGNEAVQWAMPGSQTMLIPYQQLQELTANQAGLANLQPQQFVSIAPAGGLPQTSLPLSAAQYQQLQATGTIMHFNQKNATPTKNLNQDQRGQKRLSDGSPSQLQLRPIAPAGSQVTQDKAGGRDNRSWSTTTGNNTVVSMGMKINPAHGTIIHVSSGQHTSATATGVMSDGTGMYIRQIDRNAIQIQTKDGQKPEITNKIQNTGQNLQMITVPQGMTVLQNPLNLGQMGQILGQHNSQVYMIPANQHNIVQGGLPQGLIGQQVLQSGQNVTVMQPNQLGVQNSLQYNVPFLPMNMQNQQFLPGINLTAQQLNAALAGQQLTNQNLAVSGTIPIVQAPNQCQPMTNQIAVTQAQTVQHISAQNSFVTPTSQYATLPPQYVIQPNTPTLQNNPNIQYSIQSNPPPPAQNNNPQPTNTNETESPPANPPTNQNNYITSSSQENTYIPNQQAVQNQTQNNYTPENQPAQNQAYQNGSQSTTTQNYAPNSANGQSYNVATTQPPPNYSNGSTPQPQQQPNYPTQPSNVQTVSQTNFSPSNTPTPNQAYQQNVAGYQPQSNSYPNATGQNMGYPNGNNQYQYNMQQTPNRPWFRPRYTGPASPYNGTAPPSNQPMPVPPPPGGNYNYWQES